MEEQTTCLSFREIENKLDMIIEKVEKLHKKKTKAPKADKTTCIRYFMSYLSQYTI